MKKRLKLDDLRGPENEVVKVSWMPGKRLRLDFMSCGAAVVTKVFPKGKITHVELKYNQKV